MSESPIDFTDEEWQKKFEQETGKNAIYRGNVTKGYITWLEKQKSNLGIGSEADKSSGKDDIKKKTTKKTTKRTSKKNAPDNLEEIEVNKDDEGILDIRPVEEIIDTDKNQQDPKVRSSIKSGFCPECGKKYAVDRKLTVKRFCGDCGTLIFDPSVDGKISERKPSKKSSVENTDTKTLHNKISTTQTHETNNLKTGFCPQCGKEFRIDIGTTNKKYCGECGALIFTPIAAVPQKKVETKPKPTSSSSSLKNSIKSLQIGTSSGICSNCGTQYKYKKGGSLPNFCSSLPEDQMKIFTKEEIIVGQKASKEKFRIKMPSNFGRIEPFIHLYAKYLPYFAIIAQVIVLVTVFGNTDLSVALVLGTGTLTKNQATTIIVMNVIRGLLGGFVIVYLFKKLTPYILTRDYENIAGDDLFYNKLPLRVPLILALNIIFFITAIWGGLLLIPASFFVFFSPYKIVDWKTEKNGSKSAEPTLKTELTTGGA